MSERPRRIGAITLFVEDLSRAKAFYDQAFELPVVYEDADSVVFRFENTLVNLLARGAAHELLDPAQPGAAGGGPQALLTISVDDADAECAWLADRGVSLLNGPVDREWGVRTASFADPDGHVWELAQPLAE